MSGDYIHIGKIVNTQGRWGALRVFPLTDYPERFLDMESVKIDLNGRLREYQIEDASFHKKYVIIKLKGIPDMNAAQALKGGIVVVGRDELVPLPEGSYYIFDLIGMSVYDLCGERLGALSDVLKTGANDVYVIETGGKPLLLPALKQVVLHIDLKGKKMVVQAPEGLTD